jgi:hypothetical protein
LKLFLHCGFPKTGTSSLQAWLDANEILLYQNGICYPKDERDAEGIAHHRLTNKNSPEVTDIVDRILDLFKRNQDSNILMSTESLSNLLCVDDNYGEIFFGSLVENLKNKGVDCRLIFTIRNISQYLPSITIQNILYDKLPYCPSTYASHVIYSFIKSIKVLLQLCKKYNHNVKIFRYSKTINHDIIKYLFSELGLSSHDFEITGKHETPNIYKIIPFIFINYIGYNIPSDFHSFLKFSTESDKICHEYATTHKIYEKLIKYRLDWIPKDEYYDAALKYFNFSYESQQENKFCSQVTEAPVVIVAVLKEGLKNLFPDAIADLNFLYSFIEDPLNKESLIELVLSLLVNGSEQYGKDLTSQLLK